MLDHDEAVERVDTATHSAIGNDDATLEAKKAVWTQEQRRLAQRASVPQCERYGCPGMALREAGKADETFVHTRFSLREPMEALCRMQSSVKSTSTIKAKAAADFANTTAVMNRSNSTVSLPNWSTLRHQLQWDMDQQARYCATLSKPRPQPGNTGEEVDQMAGASASPAAASDLLPALAYVGGVDISFIPNTDDGVACLAVLRYPSLELVKTYMHRCTLREPYISTFLAFREIQPVCELFDSVHAELIATGTMPQLLIVDGNGVYHPRRCGLATHLGVTLDIPTIGCSKKILQFDGISREGVEAAFQCDVTAAACATALPFVLPLVGTSSPAPLYGYAVHGHLNSVKKCIAVSPGHCVGFAVATALIVTMLRHRIPEPIRAADLGSRAFIRDTCASVSDGGADAAQRETQP